MLISHECPISLLEDSRNFNDYDYALVHLFEEYLEYYNFFEKSIKLGRKVILDNSIFELGESFDMDKFAYFIKKLQPTEYIIPDALEDYEKTISNTKKWMKSYKDLPGIKIGVVQGKTWGEIRYCYEKLWESGVDKVAFSFDYSVYERFGVGENLDEKNMTGRQKFLKKMLEEGIILTNKPHHLLGCSLPQEFSFYKKNKYNWIETIDTSSPIVHGLLNKVYKTKGLKQKEKTKLVDFIEIIPTKHQLSTININISKFRRFC